MTLAMAQMAWTHNAFACKTSIHKKEGGPAKGRLYYFSVIAEGLILNREE